MHANLIIYNSIISDYKIYLKFMDKKFFKNLNELYQIKISKIIILITFFIILFIKLIFI